MKIISQIKVNGRWVNQEDLPEAVARSMIKAAVVAGMKNINFVPAETKEKTA